MKFSDFNEGKLHGTADFPIEYYFVNNEHPQYEMPAHWHKEFEIIKVLSGSFQVFLNGVEYSLSVGDILLVESGTLHKGRPHNCTYECVVFDLNMLRRRNSDKVSRLLLPIINRKLRVNYRLVERESQIYAAASFLCSAMHSKNNFFELDVYSLIFRIFSLLYKEGHLTEWEKNQIQSKQTQSVIKIIDWIDNNFAEAVTLEKLSEISGLSPKYICRIFKEYTAKSPINYINELRIDFACHEMSNGKNITQAALDSGFNDLSYFSKTFKRFKGITPNDYRKKYIKT